MITTPYTLEELDRSLFEILRLEVVERGYLPDIVNYTSEAEYTQAKEAILQNKGFVIEVLGVGANDGRGERPTCCISLDRKDMSMGSIGGGTTQYIKEGETYRKERLPTSTTNILYDIRIYSNSMQAERALSEIVYSVLNHRGYYKIAEEYNRNSDKTFFGVSKGDTSLSKGGKMERLFKFEIQDAWVGYNKVEKRGIVPLTSVVYRFSLRDSTDEVEIVEIK